MAIYFIIFSFIAIFCNRLSADYRYISDVSESYVIDSENIRAGPEPPDDAKQIFKMDTTQPNLDFGEEDLFDLSLETTFEYFNGEEECVEPCTELNMHCQPMSSGYNAPAAIDFGCWENSFSLWGSFLYW